MIKPKEKPCKGTGLAKGYGCGKHTPYRVYGLGKSCCYPNWLMTSENGKIKMEKAIIKASKPRKEFEAAEKQYKEQKGLPTLLTNVKTACHNYIKKRDEGKPCISCGTPYKSNFQAGHYFKAELYSSLKFHEDNIHGQCEQCNLRMEGNLNAYELNLPERIGAEKYEDLKHLARQDKRLDHKWQRSDLNEIRMYYKSKIKTL